MMGTSNSNDDHNRNGRKNKTMMPYLFIALMICLTFYSQVVIKWQVNQMGSMPIDTSAQLAFVARFIFQPWIISSYLAVFLASVCWMIAVRDLELSVAYPFTSISFVLILIASGLFFGESITLPKVAGVTLVMLGIFVGTRG
jgi:multidrug transporter EmrE-like cation transporter